MPNVLSRLRLVLSPALVLLALVTESGRVVVGLLLVLQVTDWVDGPIARRQGTESPGGARMDSLADSTMFGSLLGALVVLQGPLLLGAWPWIGAACVSYAVSAGYALARFGSLPTYHQWSAKVSGPLALIAAVAILLMGEPWPLKVAAAAVTLANLEAIAITRRLDGPATDVPSVFAVERGTVAERRGSSGRASEELR
ncbi:MAG: CDP-alcohol phosphatidyltransferase family protein [Gemmatimonadota bacterium]|nr:CDP-alcohol phosphatidyltransferase family protein [Gemmatimonadota bacterium]